MTNTEEHLTQLPQADDAIRVIPLGGLGEIGMNCCLFEHHGEYLMVDCGQMMPDEDMLGIDYVIPDVTILKGREDKLAGIVITHAHEDHVGALPFILPLFPKTPLYVSRLTRALLTEKFREHGLKPEFRDLVPRTKTQVGTQFEVEPISVTHSMIDAMALAIRTPVGVVVHTGDFKIDPFPPDGVAFDHYAFARYAEEGEDGVLLLMSDSTNVERTGTCPSEMEVVPGLRKIFREAPGALIISCFASSLHRIQNVLNLAAEAGKTVVAVGLNMERNIRIASELELLDIPCTYSSNPRDVSRIDRRKLVVLCTGSQGEPMSSLSRVAAGTHRDISVQEGDTIVLSTRIIPGNETAIFRMINHLTRRGAHVIHEGMERIHVSGHGYRDDMRHMINLVNPRFFVPVHGEYRHLRDHCRLAREQGLEDNEAFLLEDGDVLELKKASAQVIGKVPHGRVLVDGKGIGDVDEVVLRDRRYLAEDGMVVVILGVDHETGEVLNGPEIVSRGFASESEAEFLEELKEVVIAAYEELGAGGRTDPSEVQAAIKKAVRQTIKKQTSRFPVILPMVLEL